MWPFKYLNTCKWFTNECLKWILASGQRRISAAKAQFEEQGKASVLPLTPPPHLTQARNESNLSFVLQEPVKLSTQVTGVKLKCYPSLLLHN